jgi:hypothetical protein
VATNGESEHRMSNSVGLKEYFEARMLSITESNTLVHANLEKRLDSMNEFREALKDYQNTMLPRAEFEMSHRRLEEDVKSLQNYRASMEGKASTTSVMIANAIAVLAMLLSVIGLIREFMAK